MAKRRNPKTKRTRARDARKEFEKFVAEHNEAVKAKADDAHEEEEDPDSDRKACEAFAEVYIRGMRKALMLED